MTERKDRKVMKERKEVKSETSSGVGDGTTKSRNTRLLVKKGV